MQMRGSVDPGEAVDPELIAGLSRPSKERFEREHADELLMREFRSRSARLRDMQNEARRLGIDSRREWQNIDAQLDLVAAKAARRRAA